MERTSGTKPVRVWKAGAPPKWDKQGPTRLEQVLEMVRLSLVLSPPGFDRAHAALDRYERQLEEDDKDGIPLDETGIPSAICSVLAEFEVFTVKQADEMTDDQLLGIPGIGPEKVRLIRKYTQKTF